MATGRWFGLVCLFALPYNGQICVTYVTVSAYSSACLAAAVPHILWYSILQAMPCVATAIPAYISTEKGNQAEWRMPQRHCCLDVQQRRPLPVGADSRRIRSTCVHTFTCRCSLTPRHSVNFQCMYRPSKPAVDGAPHAAISCWAIFYPRTARAYT